MLGTLLDKLGSLFSKAFVLGSIPLLAFLFLHGLMVYRVSPSFQKWVSVYLLGSDTGRTAAVAFSLLLAIVIVSYVLSTLSVTLREALEGKHFGQTLSNALSQRFRDRLVHLEQKLTEAKRNRRLIRQDQEAWRNSMGEAYKKGVKQTSCTYTRSTTLKALFDLRQGNQDIRPDQLKTVVTEMTDILPKNSPELQTKESSQLDTDHGQLLQLIDYAATKWETHYVDYLAKYEFDYAGKDVAPTKMGNIANAASYYANSRYSINLEVFWTRLQKVLQGDANFYALLQEAKMQVDFLVALVWLSLTFTLVWVILIPYFGAGKGLFFLIAGLGPTLTYVFYRIALQNYRAFSDLLRASIDLYRLDLLKTLHMELPVNAEQERTLWETLERRLSYGEHQNVPLHHYS
jgi:hypothetical protein